MTRPTAPIDQSRTVRIDDGFALAVTNQTDGREIWWVLQLDAPADAAHGCCCRICAPHDQCRPLQGAS